MKIRTQFIISLALFGTALLVIGSFFFVTNQQVDHLTLQEDRAEGIEIGANELSYLSSDYVLYRESPQVERWEAKYATLTGEISGLSVGAPEQQVLVNNLKANAQRLRVVFNDVTAGTAALQAGKSVDPAMIQVSWSRLAVQTQGIAFDAGRLSHLIRAESDGLRQTRNLLVIVLLGTFSLFILTSYLILYRRTVSSIGDLTAGARIIGSGNLDYELPEKGDDEISGLAASFNRMTRDLRAVTSSKAELEREVDRRKAAENALSGINDALSASNEELTAAHQELRRYLDELERSEQKVRESESRFRTVADFTMDWEFWFGPDGKFMYISPSTEQIVGRPVSGYVSVEPFLRDVVHPDDLSMRLAHLKDELAGKGPSELEFRIVRPDGEERWVHHICRPIMDDAGNFLGTRGSNRDITERRRAEEALRSAEEKYRLIVTNAPAMIYEMDFTGSRFLSVNDPMCSMLGYTKEELMAMKPADLIDPESRERFAERIRRTLAGESVPEAVEYRGHTKDGREMNVSVRTSFITRDKKPLSAIVVAHDITERKKAEDALREAQQRTSAIISQIAETFYSLDSQWRFTVVNPAAERAPFGRPASELLGRGIWDLYPNLVGTRIYRHYVDAAKNSTLEHYEAQSPLNGHWYEVFMQGREGGVDVYMRDITARRNAEAELRRKNDDLVALNEELTSTQEVLQQHVDELHRSEEALRRSEAELRETLGEKEALLAEIHHRVKNNLTAFISLLSLEGSYEDSPAGKQLKSDLQNRARSMALIHETLYRTKKYSHVDMGMYLTTLIGQISVSYGTRPGLKMNMNADSVILDLARATPCGLIVNELITNSLKYAFPPGFDCMCTRGQSCTIGISLRREGDEFLLVVSDNGIGLPRDFDPGTARSLGLKLVNFLARHQLRATIDIRSCEGTAFEFRFPVTPL